MRWAPLVAVCLGTFMLLVDVTIVNVALPDMAIDLDASFAGLQWVVDGYALALAALLLLIGSISDVVGRLRSYLIGLGVFLVSSLACGIAPSDTFLVAGRAVQGIGAAAMLATTVALLNTAYQGRDRGTAFGVWGATAGAAAATGPILGGVLTEALSWRWIFLVNIPVGLVAIYLARRALAESRLDHHPRIDWAGGAAFTVAAASLTFALIRVTEAGWTSAQTLGTLAVSVVALAVFVATESRVAAPLFDLRLMRRPAFSVILLGAVVLSVSAFGALVYLSIWLQTVLGLDAISAGLVFLPMLGTTFLVAGALGKWLHELPPRWTVGGGLALIGVGDLLMIGLGGGSSWTSVVPGLVVVGIGSGIASPTVVAAAMASVPHQRGGMAAGAVNTARQLGLAIGIALLGSVFSTRIGDLLSGTGAAGFAHDVAGGGTHAVLAQATAGLRPSLDAAIRDAAGGALGTTFLVAGLVGVVGGAAVMLLLRQTAIAPHAAPAVGATPPAR